VEDVALATGRAARGCALEGFWTGEAAAAAALDVAAIRAAVRPAFAPFCTEEERPQGCSGRFGGPRGTLDPVTPRPVIAAALRPIAGAARPEVRREMTS